MPITTLQKKTLEELRALAKARGLTGYSKLRKDELVRLLAKAGAKDRAPPSGPRREAAARGVARSRKKKVRAAAPKRTRAPKTAAPSPPAPPVPAPRPAPAPSGVDEQRVTQAKFTLTSRPSPVPAAPSPLREIPELPEPLPPVTEPLVRLLPQRPGVAYAYWALPEGALTREPGLRLRLYRLLEDRRELIEELVLESVRGERYFRLPAELVAARLLLALESEHQPQPALEREAAPTPRTSYAPPPTQLPSALASPRTDRGWAVSEEQFRALYLRAGGALQAGQIVWGASVGSPQRWASPAGEALAWSASVSSRS